VLDPVAAKVWELAFGKFFNRLLARIGVSLHFGLLRRFGNLPGDLKYESRGARVFAPITSMLVVSALVRRLD